MIAFSSRFFLLGFASLLALSVAGCDDRSSSGGSSETEMGVPIGESRAGDYLSSRIAQSRSDWARARDFLAAVRQAAPAPDPSLDRRLAILAIGSGDYDMAHRIAAALPNDDDETGLIRLILVLAPLKDGNFKETQAVLKTLPVTELSGYLAPLIEAWVQVGEKHSLSNLLSTRPAYLYHRILIADYLGDMSPVSDPKDIQAAREQLSPLSAERIGDIFLRRGRPDLALPLYQLIESVNPETPGLADRLKAAQAPAGTPLPDSLQLAAPPASVQEGLAEVFFDVATSQYNEQRPEIAQIFAQMALVLNPALGEADLLIGNILSRNGRFDLAIEAYQRIPSSHFRYRAIQQQIAHLLVEQGRPDDAITTLRALADMSHGQDLVDLLIQIGDIDRERERFSEALASYNAAFDALGHAPDAANWGLLYARGMTLERLKRWDEAEKDLLAALKFQPDHPYLLNYLAYSWADMGIKLDQAVTMLTHAVDLVPQDGYVTDSVGWVYYRMKNYEKAVTYLERAVALMPYDPTLNDHLGDAYWRVGRKREAMFQWQRALNYASEGEGGSTNPETVKDKLLQGLPAEDPAPASPSAD